MACLCHASSLIYSVTEHVISEAKLKVHGDQSTSTNSQGGVLLLVTWPVASLLWRVSRVCDT
jgi:hypothetical protein